MSGVRRCNGRKRPSDRSQALSRKRVSQQKAVVRGATMGVIGGKMLTTADLTAAIADLAKAGMAFTTHIGSHGKKIYIIDSVALAEDELALLHRKGALTRAGIRHYLVYRGLKRR